MLSYRHGFHAGNHADVLKHAIEQLILCRLKEKTKPFIYIDTHAGAGHYDLTSEHAQKTNEFQNGIQRLASNAELFPELSDYLQVALAHPNRYPGSPCIAQALLREEDRLLLMELHNQEIHNLKSRLRRDPRITIHHRDGFEGLVALLPPTPKRGLVLIDPAYEVKTDYAKVASTVRKALKRWPLGIYGIWYPILAEQRDQSAYLLEGLEQSGARNLLVAELRVERQQQEFGMCGSGMALINAPWGLADQLQTLLPKLEHSLASTSGGSHRLQWLIEPK